MTGRGPVGPGTEAHDAPGPPAVLMRGAPGNGAKETTTMDAKQIAALARAGLTDDQIETVVRVTAAPAQPSTPEAPTRGQVVRRDPPTVTDTGDHLEMVCRCLRPAIVARGGSVTGTLRDIQEATGVRIESKNCRGSYSLIGLGNAISARITAGGGMYVCHGVAWVRGPQVGYRKDRVWEIAAV